MSAQKSTLAACLSVLAVLGTSELIPTTETQKFACRTFGSGVVRPFDGSTYYLRSTCRVTLSHFTHNRVECDVSAWRGRSGLLAQVEITINKIQTVLKDGSVLVESTNVSLPYDNTYQHIFQYGIYTRLRSTLLPLTVTWHSAPEGIDVLWVEMEELPADMIGLCGKHNSSSDTQELIIDNVHQDDKCQTRDLVPVGNAICKDFISYLLECLNMESLHYVQLCEKNTYLYEESMEVFCPFFKELANRCGEQSPVWSTWRELTSCNKPRCPGDLGYEEHGPAFIPSCSNPKSSNQDLTDSCVCADGLVLNDHAAGFQCIPLSGCPCVLAGATYPAGVTRSTKCQSCVCNDGKWYCGENHCPARCVIEGPYVTTYDGKEYIVPGRCTYVASQGENWSLLIEYSEKGAFLKAVVLKLFQDAYTFAHNAVYFGTDEVTELHQSAHATVFWLSSAYVHVSTSFGVVVQLQMSPEMQLYITPPANNREKISGLCGNANKDTTDDFTASSGIVENSAQMLAKSWSVGPCEHIIDQCVNINYEKFADEHCAVLTEPSGIFGTCHPYVAVAKYHKACIRRTCTCVTTAVSLQECLCVALGSYAKACADMGVPVGDWRATTNCIVTCEKNQEFSYDTHACNRTCRPPAGPDPRCQPSGGPVDGCGCPEGTYLDGDRGCVSEAECPCHYRGVPLPPGPVLIDGRRCICEDGALACPPVCSQDFQGCADGKICIHCSEHEVKMVQKTCDSLSKPKPANTSCESGCYCPRDQYEDHTGNCVPLDHCTCVYSGRVYSAGQTVKTNCKTCTCSRGQWQCKDRPCSEKCQIFGNGHIQTFDSKWYRFDGHCQYTLVEDDCGTENGTFSVRVERVPCCDEALTCSRTVTVELKGYGTLTLSDTAGPRYLHRASPLPQSPLYTVRTVGLYIVVSVPSRELTLIWDKHTRITVELTSTWRNRVCGLCGNFDSSEMNDPQMIGSELTESPQLWKTAEPPCSEASADMFPCERNSYCFAWAQRRCMILTGETFSDCHLNVDPEPYYQSCVEESCSCEFEGKFLGFCTAVAAYAEACSDSGVCVKWRTPDLCPVYCDYYNKEDECTWHYETCGHERTCGSHSSLKLEGCYPRCPEEVPYYDENIGECTKLMNCTCYFNHTIIQPRAAVTIQRTECFCINGEIVCPPPPSTTTEATPTASTPASTGLPTTLATNGTTWPTTTSESPEPTKTTRMETTTVSTTNNPPTTTFPTTPDCECLDPMQKKRWLCGQTWTENCIQRKCTADRIELTPVVCPETKIPNCPRGRAVKISDGCCEMWTCDCVCHIYGDPHYVSFGGVPFNFLEECTYILMQERSPQHHLTIAVDNFDCNLAGSCIKGIILNYRNNTARLTVNQDSSVVQALLNNVTVKPPYEELGFRFETTEYAVSVHLPLVRSYVSLTPFHTLVISLAMEHFFMNTAGQCGVCGGDSCIRRGGRIERDDCCDQTAYDWLYPDPTKPSCISGQDVPCPPPWPTILPTPPTPCPESWLCQLFDHQMFDSCKELVNLELLKKNCEIDSCGTPDFACSSLEHAASQCQHFGICIDWRILTNGSCDVKCPKDLIHMECQNKMDDFCFGGARNPGAPLEVNSAGCFCPKGQLRAGKHSDNCVPDCLFCQGPLGEPRWPGEVWQVNCYLCKCNNQTRTVECTPKQRQTAKCGPDEVPETKCCGDQICIEKTCSYNGTTYKVGETWKNRTDPCVSFRCTQDAIQMETQLCPVEACVEKDRTWDQQGCCFTCNQGCAPKASSINITVDNCTATMEIPVCQGQCVSESRVLLAGDLQVEPKWLYCKELTSESRSMTLQCSDLTSRHFTYKHITSCGCQT